jgi:hypothetical protein
VPLASVSTFPSVSPLEGLIADALNSVRNLYLRCGHAENLVSVLLPLFNGTASKPFSRSRRLRYGLILFASPPIDALCSPRSSAQVLSANLAPTTDLVVFRPLAPRPATNSEWDTFPLRKCDLIWLFPVIFTQSNIVSLHTHFFSLCLADYSIAPNIDGFCSACSRRRH